MSSPKTMKFTHVTVNIESVRAKLAVELERQERARQKPTGRTGSDFISWRTMVAALMDAMTLNNRKGERPLRKELKWAYFMEDVKEASGLVCNEEELTQAKQRKWVGGFPGAIADALHLSSRDDLRIRLLKTTPEVRRAMDATYTQPPSQQVMHTSPWTQKIPAKGTGRGRGRGGDSETGD